MTYQTSIFSEEIKCPDCDSEMVSEDGIIMRCIKMGHEYSKLYLFRKKTGDTRVRCYNYECEINRSVEGLCNEVNCEKIK